MMHPYHTQKDLFPGI